MTRIELLRLLIAQAGTHGFRFRKWFTESAAIPWTGAEHAVEWLGKGERARLLLFSHNFARAFFAEGDRITFAVPQQTFVQVTRGGGSREVHRRAHLRRSSRSDTWRFHLREMAAAAEPLRYIRRYLLVEEVAFTEARPATATAYDTEPNYDDELLVRDAE